jgi:DNA-binding response OmpR family regulator
MNRILIAEDETRLAAFIEKGLQKNGFLTSVAEDGEQVLQMAVTGDFAMLLLDLGLPVKDGIKVLQELRDRGETLPIIIVTARSDARELAIVMQKGANGFLTKPFRFNDLLEKIRTYLS